MWLAWLKRAVAVLLLAALGGAGYTAKLLWPENLDPRVTAAAPIVTLEHGQLALRVPAAALVAEVGHYSDKLLAYLSSQYLWGRIMEQNNGTEVVLSRAAGDPTPAYRIYLVLPNDLLTAIPFLSTLKTEGYISDYRLLYWSNHDLQYRQAASQVFEASYRLPVPVSFDSLDARQVIAPLTRFILFKSRTDRRVRQRIAPVPRPLTAEEARREAEDMIEVADFYHLPLDQFAGIAAQENNYLDANGDLEHAVWKRRAAPGDVILSRRHGRVLVSDYSMGVWQITRESLRMAHRLYLQDDRDYSLLPARLRPSEDFRRDMTRPEVLTTYAGLLFRHLIDHFHGNVALAVGAYNGGCGNPNADYADSVSVAAGSARRTVEQSMALDGWQVIPVRIIPYSLPPRVEVHSTFADSVRAAANEYVGELVDWVQNYPSRASKPAEVAVSQGQEEDVVTRVSADPTSGSNALGTATNSAVAMPSSRERKRSLGP